MNNNLIERIDEQTKTWCAYRSITDLLRDCRAEIQRLLTANETLKGLCDEYQAQIKQLEVNHEFSRVVNLGLRNQNESLDAECARLEAMREYVPMTDDERLATVRLFTTTGMPIGEYTEAVEAEVIKRASLSVKDKPC